ncbi:inverted formin-2 [Aphelenchoides avenae]|nr:inverted formin-2 [Aphelenchus avenae]
MFKKTEGYHEVITHLRAGQAEDIGLERLNMLLQLLPTEEEKQTLQHYGGDKCVLGAAEQFLLDLLQVPDYKLRLEAMVFKEEFEAIMGNGNAVGFKLNSLWKINDLRAVKGGRTLLHFIAEQVGPETADAAMEELCHVQDAAKLPFESLRNDLKSLGERIKRLENQLNSKSDPFFEETKKFIQSANVRIVRSTETLDSIERRRIELAAYFCEPEKTFSLEECFKIFGAFLGRFNAAAKENQQRKEREERMKANHGSVNGNEKSEDTLSSLLVSRPKVQSNLLTSSGSPAPNRRASVILEQDRNRQSLAPRRKSAFVRSDQPFFIREQSEEV